jgi:hypothetical protein
LRLEIWNLEDISDSQAGGVVYIGESETTVSRSSSTPIPVDTTVHIDIEVGEEVWAIAENQALMGISALLR